MASREPAGTRELMEEAAHGRHPSTVSIMRHFAWAHLPEDLQKVSKQFGTLAVQMLSILPDSPELVAGLRKLIESKDCMVRAHIDATR